MFEHKISIIVPIYNSIKFLDKCITSIINQSYANLEIILVNDGSVDKSLDICKKYVSIDNRIVLIDKKNEGVSSARNKGLDVATGDFIGFVDSDDYISFDMYEKLIKAAIASNADIAECGYVTVDTNYKVLREFTLINEEVSGNYNCSYNYLRKHNTTNFNVNKLYAKTIFTELRYPSLHFSEDYVVNAKAFFQCNKKVTISDCCYFYVMNLDSACNQQFSKRKLHGIEAGKEVISFYEKRSPDLCKYIVIYVLNNIRNIYIELMNSNIKEKKHYEELLIKEYKKHYSLVKHKLYRIVKHKKTYFALWIFDKSPRVYNAVTGVRSKL